MDQDVSPPPTKRRKLSTEPSLNAPQASPAAAKAPTIRILSWNINGISPFLQKSITTYFNPRPCRNGNAPTKPSPTPTPTPPPAASLRAFLRNHAWPHLLCLQEVKIAPSDLRAQRAVQSAINAREGVSDEGPEYKAFFTLPRDKYNARGFGGKVYGVCSIIRQDFHDACVKRVRDVDWDLEGRVSVVEIETRRGRNIAVWNVYAVNGTDNPYRSPVTGEVIGTRHDRKLAFHRLLLADCRAMETEGWDVVVIGDLNVAPARIDGFPNLRTWPEQHVVNRADFNRKFLDAGDEEGLRGVDAWRYVKGEERRYTYYPRGVEWGSSCDRVDLAVVSRKLVEEGGLVGVDILDTPKDRGPSDHVPIFVEVRGGRDEEDRETERNVKDDGREYALNGIKEPT